MNTQLSCSVGLLCLLGVGLARACTHGENAVNTGTEGYAEHARSLFLRDEAMSFAEKHQAVFHHLATVSRRGQRFRLVMLTAVWMHLDQEERQVAMPNVASLLAPDGTLIISLRHGPVPNGRRMFEVSAEETILLASSCALQHILNIRAPSVQLANRLAGVTWTHLAFVALPNNALQATREDARA
jgi:hypothetical protein